MQTMNTDQSPYYPNSTGPHQTPPYFMPNGMNPRIYISYIVEYIFFSFPYSIFNKKSKSISNVSYVCSSKDQIDNNFILPKIYII